MSVTVTQKNPGWISRLIGRYHQVASKEIAVGFPKGRAQAYPDGTDLIKVALENNFGTDRIPERNFMEQAQPGIQQNTAPILKQLVKEQNKEQRSQVAEEALMQAAGAEGAASIQDAILDGEYAPNAPSTIARKKSTKPLVDTGHLKNSVTYAVRDRRG